MFSLEPELPKGVEDDPNLINGPVLMTWEQHLQNIAYGNSLKNK